MSIGYGQRIREERKRLKLTQQSVADLSDNVVQTVRNWEAGRRSPNVIVLQSLHLAGFDTHYIITGERSPVINKDILLKLKQNGFESDLLDFMHAVTEIMETI